MIQEITGVNINSAWGQLFGSPTIALQDFPVKFTEAPNVQISVYSPSDWSHMWCSKATPTISNPGSLCFFRGTSATALTFQVHIRAIGKWNNHKYTE